MKKIISYCLFPIWIIIILHSCQSNIEINYTKGEAVYNPNKQPEEELVTIFVDSKVNINEIDGVKIDLFNPYTKNFKLRVPAGNHTFLVQYVTFNKSTEPFLINFILEKDKSYKMVSTIVDKIYAKISIVEYFE